VLEYICQGYCIKDQTNWICLPNGVFVLPYLAEGKDILERVNNWHQAHPQNSTTTASIVQSNILEAAPSASFHLPPSSTAATTQSHPTATDPTTELCLLDAVTVGALKCQEEIRAHSKAGSSK
jgi:hypothetical protein